MVGRRLGAGTAGAQVARAPAQIRAPRALTQRRSVRVTRARRLGKQGLAAIVPAELGPGAQQQVGVQLPCSAHHRPTVDESNGLSKILDPSVNFWKVRETPREFVFRVLRLRDFASAFWLKLSLASHLSPAWGAPTVFRFSPSPRSSSTNLRAGHSARACLLATASGQRCGTKLQFVIARGAHRECPAHLRGAAGSPPRFTAL